MLGNVGPMVVSATMLLLLLLLLIMVYIRWLGVLLSNLFSMLKIGWDIHRSPGFCFFNRPRPGLEIRYQTRIRLVLGAGIRVAFLNEIVTLHLQSTYLL